MIKLKAGSVLLHSVNGDFELFDLNELHDCLFSCCLDVGIADQELPADIINVVTTFANDRENIAEGELDRLIIRILMDSGLHSLAALFAQKRGTTPEFILDEQVNPTIDSIKAILKSEPFFLAKPIGQLSTMIDAQLEKLGFKKCGRNLILELARNTCSYLQQPFYAEGPRYWLLGRDEIPALLTDEPLSLVTSGIVTVSSVSSLLPSLHVSVILPELASKCGAGQLAELKLYPAIDEVCHQLPVLRNQLGPVLEERGSGVSVHELNVSVVFCGVKQLANDFAIAEGNCEVLKGELSNIIQPVLDAESVSWALA